MEKYFVTHKIALSLKLLGFNEKCFGCWEDNTECPIPFMVSYDLEEKKRFNEIDNCLAAPLWQQTIDWLMENHDLYLQLTPYYNESGDLYWWNIVNTKEEVNCLFESDFRKLTNHRKYREQVILKAIEIC